MKDGSMKRCVAIASISAVYVAYLLFAPDPADGMVLGAVMALIAGLAGYDVGIRKAKDV